MTLMTKPGDLPKFGAQIDFLLDTGSPGQVINRQSLASIAISSGDAPAEPIKTAAQVESSVQRTSSSALSHVDILSGALDGLLTTVPIALVGVSLAYATLPAHYLGMGVMVTLLCLAAVHLASAGTGRPMAYSARLFEATTLSAILTSFSRQMPSWGLQGTPEQLLAMLCIVSASAGVVCALLFLIRADRFTRLIPAPVYSGFAISIGILLIISQANVLYKLWLQGTSWAMLSSIGMVSFVVLLMTRKLRPRWPATALSIAAGALVGLAWLLAGSSVAMVMPSGQTWVLPWQVADFSFATGKDVNHRGWITSVFYNSVLLGVMLFINTTVANETIAQLDDRYASRWQQAGVSLVKALGGASGSVPIAASTQAALAAMRNGPLTGIKALWIGLLCVPIALLGLFNWVALAAVAAVMLVEGYFMADRSAIAQGWAWLRGAELKTNQKEDLRLVGIVTFAAVFFNAVYAVFIGLLYGLILFAARNARKPVRFVWTGDQLHSNCARGRGEIAILSAHGKHIKILELEGELFFGSISSLDKQLQAAIESAHWVILDWSRVRHVDSSIALSLTRWQRLTTSKKVHTSHAGAGLQEGSALAFLQQHFPQADRYPDLDRALEAAESSIISCFGAGGDHEATQLGESLHIFRGLTESQRHQVEAAMPQRLFKAGATIFNEGDPSGHMLIVLQGTASVIVQNEAGQEMRITSMRRGGVIGEIGFLDRAPRSAKVMAQEDVVAAILSRETFDRLRDQSPQIVNQLLTNLTLDLATRLRHTNARAIACSAPA
jgi:sulfate permease, SulP family